MMRDRRPARVRLGFMALLLVAAFSSPALAADDDAKAPFREPGITYVDTRKPYIEWIIGSVFVAGVLLVAFKNPHRTHMD